MFLLRNCANDLFTGISAYTLLPPRVSGLHSTQPDPSRPPRTSHSGLHFGLFSSLCLALLVRKAFPIIWPKLPFIFLFSLALTRHYKSLPVSLSMPASLSTFVCLFVCLFVLLLKDRQRQSMSWAERGGDPESEAGSRLRAVSTAPMRGSNS